MLRKLTKADTRLRRYVIQAERLTKRKLICPSYCHTPKQAENAQYLFLTLFGKKLYV